MYYVIRKRITLQQQSEAGIARANVTKNDLKIVLTVQLGAILMVFSTLLVFTFHLIGRLSITI